MPLSTAAVQAAFAQETAEVFLPLVTLDHADLAVPIRVVRNTEDVTSRGKFFVAFPFDIILPDQVEDRLAVARLTIDNVSREIGQAIRLVQSPLEVLVEIVRWSEPDVVEMSLPTLYLRNVTWDATTVSGELTVDDLSGEPYPVGRFVPSWFPGLF